MNIKNREVSTEPDEIWFWDEKYLQNVIDIRAKMEYDFDTNESTSFILTKNNFWGNTYE